LEITRNRKVGGEPNYYSKKTNIRKRSEWGKKNPRQEQ